MIPWALPEANIDGWIAGLRDRKPEELWDQILGLQARLTLEEDLRFLFNEERWSQAGSVLDVGCGNGDFLANLRNYFPDKAYTGLEYLPSHYALARERFREHPEVRLHEGSIYEFAEGKYDYIILRLVIQHLPDLAALGERLKGLLNPGGTILIIDAVDSLRKCAPAVPLLENFFRQLGEAQKRNGGNRNAIAAFGEQVRAHGLSVQQSEITASPIVKNEDRKAMFQLLMLVSELTSRGGTARINPIDLMLQLVAWMNHPYAYAQLGLQRMLLRA